MPAAKRKTVARRKVPTSKVLAVRGYYDVVLRGTFECRMSSRQATSATAAKEAAERQLKDYATGACDGDNTIVVDNKASEVKPYTKKMEVELKFEGANEKAVRAALKEALGDKVIIKDVFPEHINTSTGTRRRKDRRY